MRRFAGTLEIVTIPLYGVCEYFNERERAMDYFWFILGIVGVGLCLFYIKQSWKNGEY
ncbi:uncharacterized protein DFE_3039 [Desulfovibrio ferrophilus]|uniref:Uncharacterized protein n=1 Tax=Desulfovibrio ferrophilus TaxID=241368 RepID=A0A2Z6B2U7_9BACT|nr:uncharacterized protein DFE_3039 [Desulfovibrio ferrophilus]